MVDGVEYEVDCIIYASGFEVGTPFTRRAGYDITGRDGLTLGRQHDLVELALRRREAAAHGPRARDVAGPAARGFGAEVIRLCMDSERIRRPLRVNDIPFATAENRAHTRPCIGC